MTTITGARFGYNRGPQTCVSADPKLVRELEERGFRRPVRTFADPRLRLPELLLMEGWRRSMDSGQITYLNYLEGDLDSGQSIIFHEDETRELRTTVDGVTQILRSTPDGRVQEYRG